MTAWSGSILGAVIATTCVLLLAGRASAAEFGWGATTGAAGSPLALRLLTEGADGEPPVLLAQRGVERSWGIPDDSVYVEVEVPHWREEGVALGLSALVPGAGQAYVGVWQAAALFAAVEATGWIARATWRDRGHELQDDAARYAGPPTDPGSRWSATRWAAAHNADPSELLALYAGDPSVFYDRIAQEPELLSGWSNDPEATRAPFRDLRRHADDRLRYARYATGALCLNHVVAGIEALRGARRHNAAIDPGLRLRVGARPARGEPVLAAVIERSF